MSFKKVLAVFNGEVVDQQDDKTGIVAPQAIASTETLDTGISEFTGHMSVSIGDDSGIAVCYKTAEVQVVGSVVGGAEFSSTKDTASKLNIYVEGGNIIFQNLTGADVSVTCRLF